MAFSWGVAYLQANLMILVGCGTLSLSRRYLRPAQGLKLCYGLAFAFVVLPGLTWLLPKTHRLFPDIQVGSEGFPGVFTAQVHDSSLRLESFLNHLPTARLLTRGEGSWTHWAIAGVVVFGWVIFLKRLTRDIRLISKIQSGGFLLRKVGRVVLLASEQIAIPFSFYMGSFSWKRGSSRPYKHAAYVAIPQELISCPEQLRIAIFHEIQHHRQRDTLWVYFIEFLKGIFFFNPGIHFFSRIVSEIQELACDEALIKDKALSPHTYGQCLLKAAENAITFQHLFSCSTPMGVSRSSKTLKRRIDMMFAYNSNGKKQKSWALIGLGTLALLVTMAWASQELIQDRQITLEMAREMTARIQKGKDHLPVDSDESAVVKQLNTYLGSSESRAHVREALERMKKYEVLISSAIKTYELPTELLAVPFVESGFDNSKRGVGAGIWMFIPETARKYKLKVNPKTDDRMVPKLETDAAMRLLKDDYQLFQDWRLALLAYNAGEKKVQEGILKTGSKDVWALLREGYQGDKDYIPMVMAAVLIMNNPSLANE